MGSQGAEGLWPEAEGPKWPLEADHRMQGKQDSGKLAQPRWLAIVFKLALAVGTFLEMSYRCKVEQTEW